VRPEERADERERQPERGLRRDGPEDEALAGVEARDRVGRPELHEREDEVPRRAQEPDLEARCPERERERRHERLGEPRHDRGERRLAAGDGQAPCHHGDAGGGRLRGRIGHGRPAVGYAAGHAIITAARPGLKQRRETAVENR
jgi:hypothetical protein